jgi:hypothetical protein
MDMQFLYVLAGWKGSTLDSCMFENAVSRGFTVPNGQYYLADAGYMNCDALLVPYQGIQYHLREWGIGQEQCIYLILSSFLMIVDLCHLGPGTIRSCLISDMCSFRM